MSTLERHKILGGTTLEKAKLDKVQALLNNTKGEVCKEFEKVCATDKSFQRMIKEMHDVFDDLLHELKQIG